MTTGEKIAAQRRRAGLSQAALAEKLHVSRQAVSRWETNESLPDTDKIVQLSQALGVTPNDLLLDNCPEAKSAVSATAPRRRWFRYLYIALAAAGMILSLAGLAASVIWAVTTDTWYTDFGRFGTALFFNWTGSLLFGGLILLFLALLLLVFDTLLSKRESPAHPTIERDRIL